MMFTELPFDKYVHPSVESFKSHRNFVMKSLRLNFSGRLALTRSLSRFASETKPTMKNSQKISERFMM
jgi:hypothetical protein